MWQHVYSQMSLSKPAEANVCPSGEKRTQKISPSWPVRSMIGAAKLDVLAVDCNHGDDYMNDTWLIICIIYATPYMDANLIYGRLSGHQPLVV